MIEIIEASARKVSAKTMKEVVQYLAMDPLTLDPSILNQLYTVIKVKESEFNGRMTFNLTLANDDRVIQMSASHFKNARIAKTDLVFDDTWKDNEFIMLRSKSEAIWKDSQYLHEDQNMSADEYTIPAQIFIAGAVLTDDRADDPKPVLNPFNIKGWSAVVNEYTNRKPSAYPTIPLFEEELEKTGAERIKGLPVALRTIEPIKGIDPDKPSNCRFKLMFKDVVAG